MNNKITASTASLIIANLIPLFGVLFFQWDISTLLFLYWAESAIIGFFNILKMLKCPASSSEKKSLIPFFMIHFGGFMLGHLLFLVVISVIFIDSRRMDYLVNDLTIGIIGLLISHGISYYNNYLLGEEYKRADINTLFIQPYSRIAIMHITVLAGFFAVIMLEDAVWILAVFVILKTLIDLFSHLKERKKYSRIIK